VHQPAEHDERRPIVGLLVELLLVLLFQEIDGAIPVGARGAGSYRLNPGQDAVWPPAGRAYGGEVESPLARALAIGVIVLRLLVPVLLLLTLLLAYSRGALVAVVKADVAPGAGSVQLMKNLYMAFRVNTIDLVIETHPNDARYYVGYVGWLPGELQDEIERNIWTVLSADADVVFRKDMDSLWEEMLQRTKSIRAEMGPRLAGPRLHGDDSSYAAARAGAFSKVIFEPR